MANKWDANGKGAHLPIPWSAIPCASLIWKARFSY